MNAHTLKRNAEQFEIFFSNVKKKELCQYDYRDYNGRLFSTVKSTLAECREAKNKWLVSMHKNEQKIF